MPYTETRTLGPSLSRPVAALLLSEIERQVMSVSTIAVESELDQDRIQHQLDNPDELTLQTAHAVSLQVGLPLWLDPASSSEWPERVAKWVSSVEAGGTPREDCPSWCQRHSEMDEGAWMHERVVTVGDMSVTLTLCTGENYEPNDASAPGAFVTRTEYQWIDGESILYYAEALRQAYALAYGTPAA